MQRCGDQAMEALDRIIGGKTSRSSRSSATASSGEMRPNAQDWIIRGISSSRSRPPPELDHPGTSGGSLGAEQEGAARNSWDLIIRPKVVRRPGQGRPGQIKQEEPPASRPGPPGESRGQKQRSHEAEAELVQRWSHVRMQRKELRLGDADKQ